MEHLFIQESQYHEIDGCIHQCGNSCTGRCDGNCRYSCSGNCWKEGST